MAPSLLSFSSGPAALAAARAAAGAGLGAALGVSGGRWLLVLCPSGLALSGVSLLRGAGCAGALLFSPFLSGSVWSLR